MKVQAVASWSKEAVCKWLGSIGKVYLQYTKAFLHEGIDGEELLELSVNDLVDFGVTVERHQKRIIKEIRKLADSGNCGLRLDAYSRYFNCLLIDFLGYSTSFCVSAVSTMFLNWRSISLEVFQLGKRFDSAARTKALPRLLQRYQRIKYLKLEYKHLGDFCLDSLAQSLGKHADSVEKVSFSKYGEFELSISGVDEFMRWLANVKDVSYRSLLCFAEKDLETGPSLGEFYDLWFGSCFKGVESVDLCDTNFGDDDATGLTDDNTELVSELRRIDLSYNPITFVGLMTLARGCPELREVYILGSSATDGI
jgi:hypothetical protein